MAGKFLGVRPTGGSLEPEETQDSSSHKAGRPGFTVRGGFLQCTHKTVIRSVIKGEQTEETAANPTKAENRGKAAAEVSANEG